MLSVNGRRFNGIRGVWLAMAKVTNAGLLTFVAFNP